MGAPWRSKRICLVFLQHLALSNLLLIMAPIGSKASEEKDRPQSQLLKTIQSVIMKLLKDDKLEVRELACSTLSGYIHCGVITIDRSFLRKLSKLRATKLVDSSSSVANSSVVSPTSNGVLTTDSLGNSGALVVRHAGVLGLKACIKAYPYHVPDWMPSVLMSLADHVCDPTPI